MRKDVHGMIFYFSGTGNSKYVADQLAFHCQEKVCSVADCLKTGRLKFHIQPEERVGFVTPVYFYGLPALVEDFINRITLISDGGTHYVYHVLTCGASTGSAANQMRQLLRLRGITLSASFSLVMPDGYVVMFRAPTRSQAIRQMQLAEISMNQIIGDVLARTCGDFNHHKGALPADLVSSVIYPLYQRGRRTDKFYATDACVRCGLCQKVCPVDAIVLNDRRPQWVKEQCQMCMACINRCPKQAIEYGKKTQKHGRYVNPWVKF